MDRETLNAKDLVRAGKKDRAMLQLRRRKMHEGQAARADQWMINVEELVRLGWVDEVCNNLPTAYGLHCCKGLCCQVRAEAANVLLS